MFARSVKRLINVNRSVLFRQNGLFLGVFHIKIMLVPE